MTCASSRHSWGFVRGLASACGLLLCAFVVPANAATAPKGGQNGSQICPSSPAEVEELLATKGKRFRLEDIKLDADVRIIPEPICGSKHLFLGSVSEKAGMAYIGKYSAFPPNAAHTVEKVVWATHSEIMAEDLMLFPIEPIIDGDNATQLKQPPNRPANVPQGSVWVPGPFGAEAYVSLTVDERGHHVIDTYTDFRGFNGPLYAAGALERTSERYLVVPPSRVNVRQEDIIAYRLPGEFILKDGKMLVPYELTLKLCKSHSGFVENVPSVMFCDKLGFK